MRENRKRSRTGEEGGKRKVPGNHKSPKVRSDKTEGGNADNEGVCRARSELPEGKKGPSIEEVCGRGAPSRGSPIMACKIKPVKAERRSNPYSLAQGRRKDTLERGQFGVVGGDAVGGGYEPA